MEQPIIDPRKRSPTFDSTRDGFFLTRWLHLHSFITIFRSFSRRLQKSDLFNLGKNYWPDENIARFEIIKEQRPGSSLFSKIFQSFVLSNYLIAISLIFLSCVIQLFTPFAIKEIITFLTEEEEKEISETRAYTFTWILLLSYFVKIFIDEYTKRLLFMAGLRVNQVLHHELLRKFSRMSFDKKVKTQKIYLANSMIIDCNTISEGISKSGILFSLPITAILVQIFLIIEFQYYALSYLGSFLLGLSIQYFIKRKISLKTTQLVAVQYDKYGINCEFIRSFKEMRMLGWKDLIISKNQQFREKQNKINSEIYTLKGFFNLVGNLIPLFAALLTLGLYFTIQNDKEIDVVVVFTIITYCALVSNLNMIYEPIEGFKALRRIEKQLSAEELRFSETYDQSMEKGRLVLNNLVAKWKLEGVTLENIEDMMLLEKKELIVEGEEEEDMGRQGENAEEKESKGIEKQKEKERDYNNINDSQYALGTISQNFDNNNISLTKNLLQKGITPQLKTQPEISNLKKARLTKIKQTISKQFQQLQIQSQFQFKQNRLIVIGSVESGKSSFLHLIMGNLNIQSGYAKYGGKIGYMPQSIWFRRQSVRANILFGSILDIKWLKTVYEWLDLAEEMKLLENGDQTVINENLFMTEKQKKKIAFARAVYCRPDILILDEPFLFFDSEKSKSLYERLCTEFKQKIIIISTKSTEFLRPDDFVLAIDCGKIVESGKYEEMARNPTSLIHKIYKKELGKINIVSTQNRELTIIQKKRRTQRVKVLKQKVKKFVKYLLELTKGKTREEIDKLLGFNPEMIKSKEATKEILDGRLGPIPLRSARRLFNIYPSFYVLMIFISILIQSVFAYSMYWIGSEELPFSINFNTQLGIYSALTVSYGVFWCFSSLILPHLSATVANTIVGDVTRSVAYMEYSKVVKEAYLIPTLTLNKPNNAYYELHNAIQNIIFGYITLLISIVIVSISSPIFFAIGASVSILYFVAQVYLLRAEREIHYFQFYEYPISLVYEQTITGIETLRAFQQIGHHISRSKEILYNQSVYRANHQFIFHGISIVCKLLGLALLAGAIYFALGSKHTVSASSIGLFGASIIFILDLSEILNEIVTEAVELSNILFDTIQEDFDIIDEPIDTVYLYPEKPSGWPSDGSIEFKNASLSAKLFDQPVMKDLSMRIESGQQVAIFGSDEIGKMSIIYSILRYYNNENKNGHIKISGQSVFQIGRKYLLEQVRILSSDPFSFKGSVRENMDPFLEHTDSEIIEVLKKTNVWDKLAIDEEDEKPDTTQNRLNQLFSARVRYDILQRVNISRALLKAPKILIATSITDSLGRRAASFLEDVLMKQFKDSTKIFITQNRDTIIKTDKVAYVQKSRLKDFGPPIDILNKRYKITAKKETQEMIEEKMEEEMVKKEIEAEKGIEEIEKEEQQVLEGLSENQQQREASNHEQGSIEKAEQ